jgi:hypothetical protein
MVDQSQLRELGSSENRLAASKPKRRMSPFAPTKRVLDFVSKGCTGRPNDQKPEELPLQTAQKCANPGEL